MSTDIAYRCVCPDDVFLVYISIITSTIPCALHFSHWFFFFLLPNQPTPSPYRSFSSVRLSTQPTSATLTRLSSSVSLMPFDPSSTSALALDPTLDAASHHRELDVLRSIGGSKIGPGSWGLSSVVVSMDFSDAVGARKAEADRRKEEEMWALVREAERWDAANPRRVQ